MNDIKEYAKTFQLKIKLGTKKMKLLLSKLKNPQENINLIHVTGTNGKGSVCAFLESMLLASGASVGRFLSPELMEKTEQIRFCGKDISKEKLDLLIESVKDACAEVFFELGEEVSQFEIITACAFLYFKEKKPDYVIMEVGMGGEGDATNVCEHAKFALISKISLDHTAYLGNTKKEIAKVKCGIIKNGCTVITTKANEDVTDVMKDAASQKNARLIEAQSLESGGFDLIYEKAKIKDRLCTLSLGGTNQLENAAIAVRCAREIGISDEDIIYGLEHAKNPARFEKISESFYFDGAHNANGAESLKRNIDRYFKGRPIVYIMAMMKDKDIGGTVDILNDKNAKFYFARANVYQRSAEAEDMKEIALKRGADAKAYADLKTAFKEAALQAKKSGAVMIACGSLYFYKDFKNAGIF